MLFNLRFPLGTDFFQINILGSHKILCLKFREPLKGKSYHYASKAKKVKRRVVLQPSEDSRTNPFGERGTDTIRQVKEVVLGNPLHIPGGPITKGRG